MLPQTKERREAEIKLQNDLIRMGSIKTCTNCEYWAERTKIVINEENNETISEKVVFLCSKYNMIPPLTICLTGCVEHQEYIPF